MGERINAHFVISQRADLLCDMEIWDAPIPGVFEPAHVHAYYELLIFIKGGGSHRIGDVVYDVKDFSIHLVPANTVHELKRADTTDGYEIIFSEIFINKLQVFDERTNFRQFSALPRVVEYSAESFTRFQEYFGLLQNHKNNKSIFSNVVALVMLEMIYSYNISQTIGNGDIKFEGAVRALINEYYREKKSLEFYAKQLNISINTLQRKTKTIFKKSILEMQNDKIIHEIKHLVMQQDVSIKEIAYSFNFYDEPHFNRFFRKHIGVTPSQFRKINLG